MRDIRPLVAPRSIAVIGASSNPTKSGGVLFDNLVKGKFHGPLYPINRSAAEILGQKAFPTLGDVPEKVDLVYIVLPQQHVEDAVRQCIAAGARSACIITAGFAEASPKGRADELTRTVCASLPTKQVCCWRAPTQSAWSIPRSG